MSRGPKRNYNDRIISPKIRASKYPYLPEKIEEILDHYKIPVTELARRTQIQQSGLSRCLNGRSLLSKQSIQLLSEKLDDLIPLWWLRAGPEAGALKDVLSKEREQKSPQPEADPEPVYVHLDKLLQEIFDHSPEWQGPMTQHIELVHKTVVRQPVDASPKKRQSRGGSAAL